ncbi:hypothetical protein LRP50_24745 [Enterovibrio sp. ZSDZ42]|uniref:Uncharacterized protein n=1 Tax=Enterovibrio gelatinilyticus TaxID=2899819 RepID=A0ABT5R8P3_9GAMM|nr:hypothetical protein [Enterovibrio sp. ZSDZ42]MDD1796334.1 hypothetical protein [Enterovibrio sp. ZSDZ42]
MSVTTLDFSEPFFTVKYVTDEKNIPINEKTIVLNLSEQPLQIESQTLSTFQSVIALNTVITNMQKGVLVERFASYDDEPALLDAVRKLWPLAYEIRREERLKGVGHYMSPKSAIGNIQFSMYFASSVPLNVGLHKHHVHLGGEEPQEIHTQIVGLGKMQQCTEKDLSTLYVEELMAPGTTHKPMFDDALNYPWHQYETITPSIFMAIEVLTSGNNIPR